MGKSVKRQRAKKKRERSVHPTAKYPPPGQRREPPLAHPQQSKTPRTTSKKKNSTEKNNQNDDGSIRQLMRRLPILSSYLITRQHVLIVGDGDFSFGQALVRLRRQYRRETAEQAGSKDGKNGNNNNAECAAPLGQLTVTGYDSHADVLRKYGTDRNADVARSLQMIADEPGATVRHSIDATRLAEQRPQLLPPKLDENGGCCFYDLVVFHFPHSGLQRVHVNRNLLYDFFQSVRALFLIQKRERQQEPSHRRSPPSPPQVHVTIKNQRPYIHWGLEESARAAGFVVPSHAKAVVPFDVEFWHAYGYRHQTTVGPHEATSRPQLAAHEAEAKLAQTFIFEFVVKEEELAAEQQQREENRLAHVWPGCYDAAADVDNDDHNDDRRRPKGMDNKTDDENENATFPANDRGGDTSDGDNDVDAVDVVVCDAMIDKLVKQRDRARRDQNWAEADRLKTLLTTKYQVKLCDHNNAPTVTQQQEEDETATVVRASSWSWKAKAKPKKKKTTTKQKRRKDNNTMASPAPPAFTKQKGLKITQSKS
jgi:hypothetical protein